MNGSPILFNRNALIAQIREKEEELNSLNMQAEKIQDEINNLKTFNGKSIAIGWKESIKECLSNNSEEPAFFLKSPAFLSDCIAWVHGVHVTRDIKNKVATTLSVMFNQEQIGRIQHKGKTYYGDPIFFEKDLTTLKKKYTEWISELQ